jgi:hypothetical protein
MSLDPLVSKVTSVLEGARLRSVTRHEYSWSFAFDTGILTIECLWRAICGRVVVFTNEDDGQAFGLPQPMDVEAMATEVFAHRYATSVQVSADTADLRISFGDDRVLELLSTSSGYEAWQLHLEDSVVVGSSGQLSEARELSPGLWSPTQQG